MQIFKAVSPIFWGWKFGHKRFYPNKTLRVIWSLFEIRKQMYTDNYVCDKLNEHESDIYNNKYPIQFLIIEVQVYPDTTLFSYRNIERLPWKYENDYKLWDYHWVPTFQPKKLLP